MYLSKLTLDPRSSRVVSELASRYELHRTVMSGFPASAPGRVLYRLDHHWRRDPELLVLSARPPDWTHLAEDGYLAGPPLTRLFAPTVRVGRRLLFRLRANPTVKRDGRRLGLIDEDAQRTWLRRKAETGGFTPVGFRVTDEGVVRMTRDGGKLSFLSVLYEGLLEVTDTAAFSEALTAGVGPAKGLGFGLLSVASARSGP
jgi:CRISPR system Cascade subunit CasE